MEQRSADTAADPAGGNSNLAGSPDGRRPGGQLSDVNVGDRTAVESGVLKVWIDQDLCTGDGICTDHAPEVFVILEDGIAYCTEGDKTFNDPGGSSELATVSRDNESHVIHAAGECPGECIFIEFEGLLELEA